MNTRKVTKERVNITLDKEIVKRLKRSKSKTSTLINHLLYKHFSLVPQASSREAFQALRIKIYKEYKLC